MTEATPTTVATAPGAGAPGAPAPPPRRRRWRWFRRFLAAFVLLSLGGGVWAKLEIDAIDREAERFAQTGKDVIALFGEYQSAVGARDIERTLACIAPDYANESDGTWAERLRSDRDGVKVFEWYLESPRPFARDDVRRQYEKLFGSVRTIRESKFKLSWIERFTNPSEVVIRAAMLLSGEDRDGALFERHAWFRMTLRKGPEGWRVARQELLHGETVTGDRSGFTDITTAAGIDFRARHNPLFKQPEWAPNKYEIMKYATAGVSATDYDNDGWEDIFFCDAKAPRLYRNNGDGTFTDVTTRVGLPAELPGCSVAIFADFNNDGRKDLFLGVGTGPCRLFRNDGPGPDGLVRFSDVTEGAGLGGDWVAVAAAADYDNDGKVDLYLGRYLDPRKNLPTTLFYTRNSEGNALLRNEGDFKFRDVTATAGLRDGGLTLGIAWGDYDRDGHIDVFVANDFGRNALYRNNGNGTFTDVSQATGALDFGYSMSAFLGDVNNDGHLDVYVSKVHSGQRWYGHAPSMKKYLLTSMREGTFREDWPLYRELHGLIGSDWHTLGEKWIRGNSLLLNDGSGHFRDVGEEARANPFGWYWASAMFDYDNDGRQDIYAVNGWITGKTKDDLWLPYILSAVAHIKRYKSGEFFRDEFRGELSWNGHERKVLLRNEGFAPGGVPRFSDIGMATGCDDSKDGRGLAIADFDNDGALDLVINNNPGDCGCETAPATLLRNNTGARRNWLAVELVGTTCNRDAIGAEVRAEIARPAPGREHLARQLRLVSAGCSYASQHSYRQYFGLDDAPAVDRLIVRWPGGGEETFANVSAGQLVRITQGRGIAYRPLSGKNQARTGAPVSR